MRMMFLAFAVILVSLSLLPNSVMAITEVFDDGGVAFWATGGAVESNDSVEKVSGDDSYKLVLSNGVSFNARHNFGSQQDFSTETYFSVWIYGADTADSDYIWIRFMSAVQADQQYYTVIYMNFSGWQFFKIARGDFLINEGAPSWNSIREMEILSFYAGGSETIRFDFMNFESDVFSLSVRSSPQTTFTIDASPYSTPQNNIELNAGQTYSVVAPAEFIQGNRMYYFDYWLINGTTSSTSRIYSLTATGDTTLGIYWESNQQRAVDVAIPYAYAAITIWSMSLIVAIGAGMAVTIQTQEFTLGMTTTVVIAIGVTIVLFIALPLLSAFTGLG